MKVGFHPEARQELGHSFRDYRSIRPELGYQFAVQVQRAIARIAENPPWFLEVEPGIRRCLVKQFPYALLFNITGESVLILAVMHCSREPGYWRHRL
ncbi:MAG: plasmid stabilization protein [Verrucomicrobia bacterium]|jgi:plasmid stabilization system protein ParE|nr:plasmid stabilization protein [Verrucomicrobiota bacterium]